MAALHTALQSLSPTPFSNVPASQEERATYLRTAFINAQKIVESVPLPPLENTTPTTRPPLLHYSIHFLRLIHLLILRALQTPRTLPSQPAKRMGQAHQVKCQG
ncbi:hypothetical protein ABVK25_005791 [Lepraria finkii]|uniref:Uncharacterized protein n=1 Tax=Lepraria finkii TaxID=1340010 RepID=A0ABR4B7M3_9LECA